MNTEAKITYFAKAGKHNTSETLRLARIRADELNIRTAIVASARGHTGVEAVGVFRGMNLVVVTAHTGWYRKPNIQHFLPENREIISNAGGNILTAPHVFGGLSYALRDQYNISTLGVDLGYTLRVFGSGVKVTIEIVMAAADAGLVSTNEEVVSIGGTNQGADTAVIMNPVHVQDFFKLKIKEIICKPRF